MNRRSMQLDYSGVKTYDANERINLVRIDTLKRPGEYTVPAWGNEDFDEFISRIKKAKENDSQIIFSMGAHVFPVTVRFCLRVQHPCKRHKSLVFALL